MVLSLTQLIAVTSYGNHYLRNGKNSASFSETHPVFARYNKALFKEIISTQNLEARIIANNPIEWFHYLKNGGCRCLRLCLRRSNEERFLEESAASELIGYDTSWLIEAVYENDSNYWVSRTEQEGQGEEARRSVVFAMIAKEQKTTNLQIDNQAVRQEMSELLAELAEFADAKNLDGYSRQFESAKMMLESEAPEKESHLASIIPVDNYSLVAKQNIFAACRAWVFGGMGSWSDLTFGSKGDYEIYERLSKRLYKSIIEAIMAGVNSY